MKIRKFILGYTAAALLLSFFIVLSFSPDPSSGRDMVYYNEQYFLIREALKKGEAVSDVEREYGCEILLLQDGAYEINLQEALKQEAMILDYKEEGILKGKIIWQDKVRHYRMLERQLQIKTMAIAGLVFAGGYFLLAFLYVRLIRPFRKLETVTGQVAKGNLDFPLPIGKKDYFGSYTESFDLMREELKRARESAYRVNQSKKELIAELSHDIKTPVATIMAACDVMQEKEKDPDTLKKVALIAGKAKVIQKLVDNLFHATLEELSVLTVEPVEASSLCLGGLLKDSDCYGQMLWDGELPECLIYIDKIRLLQVLDNCFNNAFKYAGTPVEVRVQDQEGGLCIQIRDRGAGVTEEDLPFVAEKFYRGGNAKGKDGSGLGLYLSKMFMENMQGGMEYFNENGFVVRLYIRKAGARTENGTAQLRNS